MSSLSASAFLVGGAGRLAVGAAGRGPGTWGGSCRGAPPRGAASQRLSAGGGTQQRGLRLRDEARLPAKEGEEIAPAHDPELLRNQVGGVHHPVKDQAAREEAAPPDGQQRKEVG